MTDVLKKETDRSKKENAQDTQKQNVSGTSGINDSQCLTKEPQSVKPTLAQALMKVLAVHNLEIVDCNFYGTSKNGIPKSHYVPANLKVSSVWLAKAIDKELKGGSDRP